MDLIKELDTLLYIKKVADSCTTIDQISCVWRMGMNWIYSIHNDTDHCSYVKSNWQMIYSEMLSHIREVEDKLKDKEDERTKI